MLSLRLSETRVSIVGVKMFGPGSLGRLGSLRNPVPVSFLNHFSVMLGL